MRPEEISLVFAKGYSGKNDVGYYEIDAEELDPVIIATMEEVGKMFGFDYVFVSKRKILSRDFWRPYKTEKDSHKKPYCAEVELTSRHYEETVQLLNGKAYYENRKLYLYKMA